MSPTENVDTFNEMQMSKIPSDTYGVSFPY